MSRRIGRLVTAAVLSGSLAIGFAGFSAPAVANPNNSQRAEVVASHSVDHWAERVLEAAGA